MEMYCKNQIGPTDRGAWKPNKQVPKPEKNVSKVSSDKNTPNTSNQAITDLYMQYGDDYLIDDNAFSEAQIGTGDNETVASVVGDGSGGTSETNSNVNTGVFGGSAHAAKPGESLWK